MLILYGLEICGCVVGDWFLNRVDHSPILPEVVLHKKIT